MSASKNMSLPAQKKIKIFFSYSHIDEKLRDKLAEHLSQLNRIEIISEWHDRKITGGTDFNNEINKNLDSADIILLLISSSFLASDYCYKKEMPRAMERHNSSDARVIPIILRPCDWRDASFTDLLILPKDSEPVTKWENEDDAFLNIAQAIRKVAEELQTAEPQISIDEPEVKKIPKISVTIPTPIVSFVERHDKINRNFIETVHELLNESEHRTVVLWGYGGVVKTTLAAQIARLSEGKKQVIWISADGRTEISAGILLDEIVTQIGQPEIRQIPPTMKYEQTLSLLRDTPSIIILDNFETLKPEFQTECLDFLKIKDFESLITTRDKLDGVRNLNIFEMTEAEANSYLDRLIEDSTFPNAFTAEIRQKTIETAEQNPLIMQWIVGQIDAAKLPREVFEELQHGEGDASERVFDRSFNLPQLGNDGRNILLALSLFALSARRKSIREVVGINDVKKFNKGLKSLANLRLINVTDGSERIYLGGLTRQFARAYLEKKDNHKSYYRRFIQYFEIFARTHTEPTINNLNHLEEEKVNFFTAIDLAFELENWKSAFSISQNLAEFLDIRGHWADSISNSTKLLNLAKELNDLNFESCFINSLGVVYVNQGETNKAEICFNEALKIDRKLGNQSNIATSLGNLAIAAIDQGEIEKAEQLYNESLEIYRKLGDQLEIARTLNNIGSLAINKGEIEEANQLYNESLEIKRKLGDQSGIAVSLHGLASLASDKGEIEKAEQLYNESLEIYKKLGDKSGIAFLLNSIGELYFLKGEIDDSENYCRESLEICEKLEHAEATNENKRLLGQIFQSRGDLATAENYYRESLDGSRKIGYQWQIALTLKEFASLAEAKGEKKTAIEYLDEALEIFEKIGSPKAAEVRADLERLAGD